MKNYNYQAFTPEEVEQGLLNDLLNYLLDHNKKNTTQYYDIHITTDGYCSIVEWTDVSYDSKYGPEGKFEFVDGDQVVMLERIFPDNHTELCYDEEDYQERLKQFLEEHPGWVKNQWGCWTNEIDNEELRKLLENGSKATALLEAHKVKEEESLREVSPEEIQEIVDGWAEEQGVKDEK